MSRGSEIKKRRIIRSILSEWYDRERAEVETVSYSSKALKVSDLASELLKKTASPKVLVGIKLREYWPEIVGKQIASVSEPLNMIDGVAEIGVFHNAWIKELNGPIKTQIIEKINQVIGAKSCREIRFSPCPRPR